MDYSSTSTSPPKDWQAFERACRVLFECILEDPQTQLNGRGGQPQHGVDVFGRRGGSGPYVGVQCKGKERKTYGKKVTEKELREEVKKAFNFEPQISEFILVTTAPNDEKIQRVARLLIEENKKAGRPIIVAVWGWEEIVTRIGQYPAALQAFHPDLTPYTSEIISREERIEAKVESGQAETRAQLAESLDILRGLKSSYATLANTSGSSTKEQNDCDAIFHRQIDSYRDLIGIGRSKIGLDLLKKLKNEIWGSASPRIKFRIETNIGAATLRLGDEKAAADIFLSAIEYDPTDKVGMANVALAHLIKGAPDKAILAAKDALRRDPDNEKAACYLIQASFSDKAIQDPFILVPENLRKSQGVLVGAIIFWRRRGMPQWRKLAQEAEELFPEAEEIKRLSAESHLDSICESRWVMLGHCTSTDKNVNLTAAAASLQFIWARVKSTEDKPDVSLPNNLALIYRILGRNDDAAKVLDEALSKEPDDPGLLKSRAIIHISLKESEKALKLLLEKRGTDPDAALMTAELLLDRDPLKTREIALEIIEEPGIDVEHRVAACLARIESYIREDKRDIALEHARSLVAEYPNSLEAVIALSNILHQSEDSSAEQTLLRAKDLINESASFVDRFLLAKELYDWERYDEAIEILEGHVDFQRDTPALQLFLSALRESDQRQRAYRCIEKLSPEVAEKPWYLKIQAAVYINRGDYPSAEKAIEKYLQLRPDDLAMRHTWVRLVFRRADGPAKIKTFLEGNVEELHGDAFDKIQIALLLERFGFEERALKFGYRIFLENPNNPEVHTRYFGLLLLPNRPQNVNLNVEKVGIDTAFVIRNDRGDTDYFIIEKEENLRKDSHYIAPDHELAQKIIGLRVGDPFTIDRTIGSPENWEIVSVKHKYIDCLHKSMEHFNLQFPTFQGFQRIAFDSESPKAPKVILETVKARHDSIQSLLDQFEKSPIPIFILSELSGTDEINAWLGLIQTKRKFRTCMGSIEERDAAIKLVTQNSKKGCVTDALTLYLIRRIGVEDAIFKVCGRIGVTETSIDVFRSRKEEIEFHGGKPFLIISFKDGQYFKEEITTERLQATFDEINQDLLWIEKNCDILPAERESGLSPASKEISKKCRRNLFDTILAADGSNRILLCEDFYYRLLAIQNEKVPAVWLQPVLIMARDEKIVALEKYDQAVYSMLEWGFEHTAVDAGNILRAANSEAGSDEQRFNKMAEALGGPSAEMRSHINVAAAVFNEIWVKHDPLLKNKAQTGQILECLLRGRTEDFWPAIRIINILVQKKGFREYLRGWLSGHFIG